MTKTIKKFNQQAFSLVELSILITVIAIVTSSFLVLAAFASKQEKVKIFKERIDTIYSAIGSFVGTNRRLPCPAALNLSKNEDDAYGVESVSTLATGGCNAVSGGVFVSTSSNNLFYGALPVASLGLQSKDGEDIFGNKLVYIVDQRLATASGSIPDFSSPSFSAIGSAITSIIQVRKKDFSGNLVDLDSNAIFVIMSHGENKNGAFPSDSKLSYSAPTDTDELDNYYANPTTFNDQIIQSSDSSDVFDDYVFYKNRSQLVSDFQLNKIIACDGSLIGNANYPLKSTFFDQNVYSYNGCSNPAGTFPYRRCGTNGNWDQPVECPAL